MPQKRAERPRPARRVKGTSYKDVVALAKDFPELVESTSYGTPALKVGKKLVVRLKEDGETIVLAMDFISRDFVLNAEPDVFFLTDHYREYPFVLVRLSAASKTRVRELLEDALRFASTSRSRW